jgi:magnesium-transporting ATPase (P-type)
MAFAGTMTMRGQGDGAVTATGLETEVGRIAASVLGSSGGKPPLLVRMEIFTMRVALLVGIAVVILAGVSLVRGAPWGEIFLLAVALAVSAVPEGLPVALTVALAVGMRRMARRNVIVRRLVAVEALGSCTAIASDKTGTLTVNELTVRTVCLPSGHTWGVTGEGTRPDGELHPAADADADGDPALIQRLCRAASLTNEAFLGQRDGRWIHTGDAVDVALLIMAHKAGLAQSALLEDCPQIDAIPFESSYRLTASLNRKDGASWVSAKGAFETLLPLCDSMATEKGDVPLDQARIEKLMTTLAEAGYRVLALADGHITLPEGKALGVDDLNHLTLLGLVGMIDPLRPEAEAAVAHCLSAGIQVSMVTGDHPGTALAIARDLGMASSARQVVTGIRLREAKTAGEDQIDRLTREARVFARVEPEQKLDIVHSMQRNGHFVAVTGDGANDAPALRAAHVGVAMGKNGTDVARETADLILADDNFASIVGGVEEGRVAYANVRKVIFLLISTGAAELVLFTLALIANLPLPLVAVQLLWLNLVTNGIQDVALALEPAEGGELDRAPRPPREPVFNRLMIERVVTTALVMGVLAFLVFQHLLSSGQTVEQARNGTLLLMVLFENVQAFNSRSESCSVFFHNPLRNPVLLFGTIIAQAIHIGAMYVPWLNEVLGVAPVSLEEWGNLLGVALILLVVMEVDKFLWRLISHVRRNRVKPEST